jgi:Beta-lactamase enzyme family
MKRLLIGLLSLCLTACAAATPPAPAFANSPLRYAIDVRVDQLIPVLKGEIAPDDYFTTSFIAAVPAAQFKQITTNFITQYGQPLRIVSIEKKGINHATVRVEYEKAIATIDINVESETPNKVDALFATGFAVKDDSIGKITADFAVLPGKAGFVVEKLNDDAPNQLIAAHNSGEQLAIASTFKLYILAELAEQVKAGQRSWGDVVPLSQRSFSSQATRNWPKDVPVTLATLALQMISVSDNSAADTLLHVLGRTAVEKRLALIGHDAPDKALPFLSTVEAFALKSPSNEALRNRYLAADEAKQREIIETEQSKLGFAQVDDQAFSAGPAFIDTIEWFASPYDIANLLDNIRRSHNDRMMEIMAVNTGLSPADTAKWRYIGYKGGEEPGVISMSFLLYSKSGNWYAVTGSWNDPAKAVDEDKFLGLMTRLLGLVDIQ